MLCRKHLIVVMTLYSTPKISPTRRLLRLLLINSTYWGGAVTNILGELFSCSVPEMFLE